MTPAVDLLKKLLRICIWSAGGLVALVLVWFAANRSLDERPDSRRDAFVDVPEERIPDARNMAVGIVGLNAPRGADFMQHGAQLKTLYEQHLPWGDLQEKIHGGDELKLTVDSDQIRCWIEPDWDWGKSACLPFEQAPRVLKQNGELLARYKSLYKLHSNVNVGYNALTLIDLTKLAVAEIHLDLRRGAHDAAYAKWRDNLRFTRNYLHGRDTWIGKSVGMVNLGISLSVLDDIVAAKPVIVQTHYRELLELLKPEGIELINPAGLARAQYLGLEGLVKYPDTRPREFEEWIDRLARVLGQPNRTANAFLNYSTDYVETLRQPWAALPDRLASMRRRYVSFGWNDLIDPFGSLFFLRHVYWQLKPSSTLMQVHWMDGRLRLATLAVHIVHERVDDRNVEAFLAKAGPELRDPFSGKPMRWDAENGRVYLTDPEDKCSIAYFRVPVLDPRSARRPPKINVAPKC